MTSRILAALMVGVLVIAPGDATAQDGTASARQSQSNGQAAVPQEPAILGRSLHIDPGGRCNPGSF